MTGTSIPTKSSSSSNNNNPYLHPPTRRSFLSSDSLSTTTHNPANFHLPTRYIPPRKSSAPESAPPIRSTKPLSHTSLTPRFSDPLSYNPAHSYIPRSTEFYLPPTPPTTQQRTSSLGHVSLARSPTQRTASLGLGKFGRSLVNLLDTSERPTGQRAEITAYRRFSGVAPDERIISEELWQHPCSNHRFSATTPNLLDQRASFEPVESPKSVQRRGSRRLSSISGFIFGGNGNEVATKATEKEDKEGKRGKRISTLFKNKLGFSRNSISEMDLYQLPNAQTSRPLQPPSIPPHSRTRPAPPSTSTSTSTFSSTHTPSNPSTSTDSLPTLHPSRKISSSSTSSQSSLGSPETPSVSFMAGFGRSPSLEQEGGEDYVVMIEQKEGAGMERLRSISTETECARPPLPPKSARRTPSIMSLQTLAESLPSPPNNRTPTSAPGRQHTLSMDPPVNAFSHRPTLSQSSSFVPAQEQGLTKSGGVYVSARLAREHERILELGKRKKGEFGMVLNSEGVWVKDGYKLVDGVEKKVSSSGVYTPPTFPGPAGPKNSHYPSNVYTPPHFAGPTPRSHTSPSMTTGTTTPSPNSSYFPTLSPGMSSRKSSFSAALTNLANRDSGGSFGMGWRRSSSNAGGESPGKQGRGRQVSSPVELGVGGDFQTSPLSEEFRPRDVGRNSDAGRRYGDGSVQEGVGLGYPIDLDARERPYSTLSAFEGDVPAPMGGAGAGKNVKGLSLPLSETVGYASERPQFPEHGRSASGSSVGASTPGTGGLVSAEVGRSMEDKSKGVKRKPVPMLVTSDSGGIVETGIAV